MPIPVAFKCLVVAAEDTFNLRLFDLNISFAKHAAPSIQASSLRASWEAYNTVRPVLVVSTSLRAVPSSFVN